MEKSSFFNSVNGDRKYNAKDFADYFNSFIGNGVFGSNNLQIQANNNMTITLKPGKAWANGYIYLNTDDLIKAIEPADGILNRIDRLVLRLDYVNREIKSYIKKGTFASNPATPALQRDADMYELGVADIYIVKGATSIVQANITDTRANSELCGWVNTLISGNIDALINDIDSLEDSIQALYTLMAELTGKLGTHENKTAKTTEAGHIQLATNAEVTAGTVTTKAVPPSGLKVELDKKLATANLLTEIKKVDGSGSGLDADTVRGKIVDITVTAPSASGSYRINETINVETVTKSIPIGNGKTKGRLKFGSDDGKLGFSYFVDITTNYIDTIVIGNYSTSSASNSVRHFIIWKAADIGFVFGKKFEPSERHYGTSTIIDSFLQIEKCYISGTNIVVIIKHKLKPAEYPTPLNITIEWEVW